MEKQTSKRGRPRQFEEAKENGNHRMTPTGHMWIEVNKDLIENMARRPYHVQWKLGGGI